MKKKILVTGGNGRFAAVLKEKNKKLNLVSSSLIFLYQYAAT